MYGAVPSIDSRKEGETSYILKRSIVWKVALATTLSLLMASISSYRMVAHDKNAHTSLSTEEVSAWSCDNFDDDTTITPSKCGDVDRLMCKYHCMSDWCQSMCGDMCDAGQGALCAYGKLSNLKETCSDVESEILANGRSVFEEMAIESKSVSVYESACRRTRRTPEAYFAHLMNRSNTDDDDPGRGVDPRNSHGFPVCDHHAFCGFCAHSDECVQIVPKVPSATRIESGGCAAAALGRIVSICDEFKYFSPAAYKQPATIAPIKADQDKERLQKIFYINCDTDTERRAFQEAQLSRLGLPYERFECVSGETFEEVFASRGSLTQRFASKELRNPREGAPDDLAAAEIRAHTVGVWLSHYLLFEKIASYANDKDKQGIYLILEDDALLPPEVDAAAIDRAAASLPKNWAYASLNVHESICLEDRVNEDWFVKRGLTNASLFGNERLDQGTCTPKQIDNQWNNPSIFYLSAAAQLVRPKTAKKVTEWLDSLPIYHVDALLRTPDGGHLPSFQFKSNLISTATNLGETRRGHLSLSQSKGSIPRRLLRKSQHHRYRPSRSS